MITVEMAALIPFISLILVGIVFLFLFFLDISVAKSEAMRIADEAAATWKTNGNLVTGEYQEKELLSRKIDFLWNTKNNTFLRKAEKRLADRITERLLIATLYKSDVSMGMQNIKAEVQLTFQWPLKQLELFIGTPKTFCCLITAPVDNWQEWLRKEEGFVWR